MSRKPGDQENMLRFYEKMGEGEFGAVYRAQGADGRMCAVKEIAMHTEEQAYAAMKALGALARLNGHKNLVRLLNTDQVGRRAYVISELSERNLNQHVCAGLPVNGWRFFCDVAHGLQYLSQQHILHRRIKPDNVMVHGGGVKLSDVGHMRALEQASGGNIPLLPANAYTTMASEFYAAPEVIVSGEARYGPGYMNKSDVFSAGLIFLVLFTRCAGRFADNRMQLLPHIAQSPLAYSSQERIDAELGSVVNMSNDARRLLSGMLQLNVQRRSTSEQVAQIFQQQDQLQWPIMAPGMMLDVWYEQD